ncbi:MAG: hypothetical protein ACLQIB_48670 [Isosphaeraceae bacterium]
MPASWGSHPVGAAPPPAAARPDQTAAPATAGKGRCNALRGDILLVLFDTARPLVKCTRPRASDMGLLAILESASTTSCPCRFPLPETRREQHGPEKACFRRAKAGTEPPADVEFSHSET